VATCDLQRHRHQQRHRADIIHEAREQRAQADQRREAPQRSGVGGQSAPRQHIHCAGGLQAAAQHQYAGDSNNRGMAKTAECRIWRHQPRQNTGQQGAQRHHVMSPAPPEKHPHGRDQYQQDKPLIDGHRTRSII